MQRYKGIFYVLCLLIVLVVGCSNQRLEQSHDKIVGSNEEADAELSQNAEEISLSFRNYEETHKATAIDSQEINIVKEAVLVDLSLIVFNKIEEESDFETLYAGVKLDNHYYVLGEIGYGYDTNGILLESVSLNGETTYKLSGFVGANAPVSMYVKTVDGKPHIILHITAHTFEVDLDNNCTDIIIAASGTVAQTEIYVLDEVDQVQYTSLNDAIQAQAVLFNPKDRAFEAYYGNNKVKAFRYQKGILREINQRDIEVSSEIPQIITIRDNDISIDLPIDQIPEIQTYLQGETDLETEISRMHGSIIKTDDTQALIVLNYSCGTKLCDTVLIRKQGEEITSLKLPFGIFTKVVFSPNDDRAVLVYGVNESNALLRNFLTVVHLDKMTIIQPQSEPFAEEFFHEPIWPIVETQWLDNDTIQIAIPDIPSSEWDPLVEWNNDETKQTKEVTIALH